MVPSKSTTTGCRALKGEVFFYDADDSEMLIEESLTFLVPTYPEIPRILCIKLFVASALLTCLGSMA